MRIDPRKCVACGNCLPVCPVGAIYVDTAVRRATVNQDQCVECYACFRGMSMENLNPTVIRAVRGFLALFRLRFDPEPDVCPTSAISPEELEWPRIVRRAFSDPLVTHESTGVHGRGTEEIKTNDVSGRIGPGEAGFTVEFGRPTVAARFGDIQKMTMALAAEGLEFEKRNPVTHLMSDTSTGRIREDILQERILSAIVEFKTTLERVPALLRTIRKVAATLDTVVLVGIGARCDDTGASELGDLLAREGFEVTWGKTNLGLGRGVLTAVQR
jgi:ferredoxin